jgi:hypothetical protein
MALEQYWVEPIDYSVARPFVEQWHYSKNTNGIKIYKCFGLYRPTDSGFPALVGAMIYGQPAMNHQASKWNPSNPDKCIELRRLCCIDDTPKNTESFFIGRTFKWLRKNTDIELIISYADPMYGHEGTIYKATNFTHAGLTAPGIVIMLDGKKYHDRTLRMNKPYAQEVRRRHALGETTVVKTLPKHIYTYRLR